VVQASRLHGAAETAALQNASGETIFSGLWAIGFDAYKFHSPGLPAELKN
jgi:hypothetical protein